MAGFEAHREVGEIRKAEPTRRTQADLGGPDTTRNKILFIGYLLFFVYLLYLENSSESQLP